MYDTALAYEYLSGALGSEVASMGGPPLKLALRSWESEDDWRAGRHPKTVTATEDGDQALPHAWCGCQSRGGPRPVYYERWNMVGCVAHGWLCPTCRQLRQSG